MPVCLACGKFSNCLTIDPCEHCGAKNWDETTVLKPEWLEKTSSEWLPPNFKNGAPSFLSKAADGVSKAITFLIKTAAICAGVGLIGFFLYLMFASEQTKLSSDYNVPEDHVFVQAKPHGCAFDDAPLGNKHCRYEKHVDVERVCPQTNCQVTSVYVSWSKVDD